MCFVFTADRHGNSYCRTCFCINSACLKDNLTGLGSFNNGSGFRCRFRSGTGNFRLACRNDYITLCRFKVNLIDLTALGEVLVLCNDGSNRVAACFGICINSKADVHDCTVACEAGRGHENAETNRTGDRSMVFDNRTAESLYAFKQVTVCNITDTKD